MYRTPSSKRGGSSNARATAPFTPRKQGLFEDGQWLCECRKPALSLTVKKEGPNKGKQFYKCDISKCGLFLWEHDAKARERDALMTHNCLSENGIVGRIQAKGEQPARPLFAANTAPQHRIFKSVSTNGRGSLAPSQDSDYLNYDTDEEDGPQEAHARSFEGSSQTMKDDSDSKCTGSASAPPYGRMPDFAVAGNATPSVKRKRCDFLSDSEEDSLDDLDMERELAAAVDESVRKKLFQTPAADRVGGGDGLPTPSTRMHRNVLLFVHEDHEQHNKRLRFSSPGSTFEGGETQSQSQRLPAGQGRAVYMGDMGTPTPYRKFDAFTTSATPSSALMNSPPKITEDIEFPKIVDEALELLGRQPEALKHTMRQTLRRYELRVKGVVMGREAARREMDVRDQKIAELQARIVDLENARQFNKGNRFDKEKVKQLTDRLAAQLSDGLLSLSQEEEQ